MVQYRLLLGNVQRGCFLIVEPIEGSNRHLIVDDRLLDWIAVRIPHLGLGHNWHGRARAIGIGEDGKILAAVAISGMDTHNWNAELSIASDTPRWATRGALKKILSYPFDQLGLGRVTAVCLSSNARAINLNRKLGFKEEGRMRRAAGDDDVIIMGLLKEEAERWLSYSLTK